MAEENNIQTKVVTSKKRRILRKILISILFIWVSLEILFFFFATPLLRTGLQSYVETESKGVYSIDFDKISIEITTRSLKLHNFKLIPDTVLYNKYKKENNIQTALYEITFDDLSFKYLKILKLLRLDKLELGKIVIDRPTIKIFGIPEKSKSDNSKYDAIHNDLYKVIAPYFSALVVKEISLNDGYFNLQKNSSGKSEKSVADKISVRLHNFYLDSTAFINKKKLFYSDSLILEVDKYKLLLNDGIHKVSADKAIISLADSTVSIKNVKVFPYSSKVLTSNENVIYNINAPDLKLTGIDVYKAWFDKEVLLKKIEFNNATIKIRSPAKDKVNSDKKKSKTDFKNFYTLLKGKLKAINVESLSFNNTAFTMFKASDTDNIPSYKISNFTLHLSNFSLDSTSYYKKNKILYSDNISMQVDNYYMKLNKSNHSLRVGKFEISTKNRSVNASNLTIEPLHGSGDYSSKINIKLPNFSIKRTDFIKAYNYGIIHIGELNAEKPVIDILKLSGNKKRRKISLIYNLVSEYVNTVNIDKINLRNGKFNIIRNLEDNKSAFFKGDISLKLRDFKLDENTAKRSGRLFYATGFDVDLNNYSMKSGKDLHILNIGRLKLSTFQSLLKIENLEYFPKDNEKAENLLKKYKKSTLSWFFVDNLTFSGIDIKKALFRRELNISSININKPELFIHKYKNFKEEKPDTTLIENLFPLDELESIASKDSINSDSAISDDLQNKSFKENYKTAIISFLSGKLNIIDVKSMKINSGFINVTSFDSTNTHKSYFNNDYFVNVKNLKFNIDSLKKGKPIFKGDFKIGINNYDFLLGDKVHKLKVKNIIYQSKDSSITANIIRIIPNLKAAFKADKRNTFMFFLQNAKIDGIDIESLITKNILTANKITAPKPYIIITKNLLIQANRNNNKKKSINIKLPSYLKGLSINEINLSNGKFELSALSNLTENIFSKADLNIKISNFSIDSVNSKNPFKYEKANISLTNMFLNLPDSMYTFTSDSINLSLVNNEVYAKNIAYRYDTTKNIAPFLKKLDRRSMVNISVAETKGYNADINSLITEQKLHVEEAFFDSVNVDITRYKNKPPKQIFNIVRFETRIRQKIAEKFTGFKIDKMYFTNTNINTINKTPKPKLPFYLKNISACITDFDIDTAKYNNKSRILLSSNLSVNIPDFYKILPNKMYSISADSIQISSSKNELIFKSAKITPLYQKYDFAKKLGYRKAVVNIKDFDIKFSGIDFHKLTRKDEIFIDTIDISNMDIYTFKDLHQPEDSSRQVEAPWKLLSKSKNLININNVLFDNVNLKHEQNSKKHKKTGIITLNDIKGSITDITNDTLTFESKKFLRLMFSCYLQDSAFVSSSFRFPLKKEINEYTIGGSIDTFNLKIFNPYIENVAFASVKKGMANKIDFHITANDTFAEGELKFLYKDLKIKVIDTSESKKGLVSWIANVLIPSNNPKNRYLSGTKVGEIYAEKVSYKSVFHLWTQALISGAYSTFGFKTKQMKKRFRLLKELEKLLKKEKRTANRQYKKSQKAINKEIEDDLKNMKREERKNKRKSKKENKNNKNKGKVHV